MTTREPSERKPDEEVMAARLRLVEAADSQSLAELLRATLDEAEALTDSQVGFYHFLEADQATISLQAWSTNTTQHMCRAEGLGQHYSLDAAGVWVDCVRERRPVIHNEYASLPHRKGLPEGHVPVVRELVVPVLRGDVIMAVLGVGNKPTDYDQADVRTVATLADLAWDIVGKKRVERALRESEERFRRVSAVALDVAYSCRSGQDGVFSMDWMVGATDRITGYTVEEILAQSCWRFLVFEEDVALFEKNVVGLAPGTRASCELRLRHKDGGTVWVASFAECSSDPQVPGCLILYGSLIDITHRRQEEELLGLTQFSIDHAADSVFWIDSVGRIVYVNEAACRGHGYSRDEMQVMTLFDLAPQVSQEQWDQHWRTIKERGSVQIESVHRAKDGTVFPVDVNASYIKYQDKEYSVSFCRDMTARKRNEAFKEAGREILQILNEPGDLEACIQRIVSTLKIRLEFDAVGIRFKVGEDFPYLVQDGFPADFLLTENTLVERAVDGGLCRDEDGNVSLECTCGLVISGGTDPSHPFFTAGGSFWTNDSLPILNLPATEDPRLHPRNQCIHQGYASIALVPIRDKERIVGLIQLNDRRKGRFSLEAVELVEAIAAHIGAALMRRQAEEAMRNSQELLKSYIRQSPVYTYVKEVTPTESRVLEASDNFVQMIGVHGQNMVGRTMAELFPPEFAAKIVADDWSVVSRGSVLEVDEELNGRTYTTIKFPIIQGEKTLLAGYTIDITERKEAERSLRLAQFSIDNSADFTIWLEQDGHILNVSESACVRLGYSRDELLAMSVFDLDVTARPEAWPDHWRELREHGPHIFEGRNRTKGGELFPVEIRSAIFEHEGRVYDCGIVRDISERRRLEDARAESQRTLTTLMANLPGMVYRCLNVREWSELFLSEGCEKLTGYASADLLPGGRVSYGELIHPEDREMVWQEIQAGVAVREPFRLAYRIVTANGETKWVWEQGQAVFDDDDSLLYLEGFVTDISERVNAEQAVGMAQEQLLQSQKMEAVGQLAGGIAHDFNNLLAAILGYSELLLASQDLADSPAREDVEEIKRAADRAAALTRQILAFSRRQALRPAVVSLNDVLDGMEPLLRRTLGEDIDLVSRRDPYLGHVEADVHQFEQVIMNLAVNARDAMVSGGRLTLETANVEVDEEYCRTHPEATPGSYVMLSVSDTGAGMDEATRKRVFEPFFTTKAPGLGTGLGLATVYGIVRQSNGSIFVESRLGKGTRFKILLPRALAPVVEERPATTGAVSAGGEESILLVEDEISLRNLATRVLGGLGYRVLGAGTAAEALTVAREAGCRIDLLLTDVVLPGGAQGNELARELLALCPGLPVLYMSGYPRDSIVHAGRLDPDVNFLEKPFAPDELAKTVRAVLDGTSK